MKKLKGILAMAMVFMLVLGVISPAYAQTNQSVLPTKDLLAYSAFYQAKDNKNVKMSFKGNYNRTFSLILHVEQPNKVGSKRVVGKGTVTGVTNQVTYYDLETGKELGKGVMTIKSKTVITLGTLPIKGIILPAKTIDFIKVDGVIAL